MVRGHTALEEIIDHPLEEMLDPMTDRRADPHKRPQPATTAYRRLATVELPHAVGAYATARYSLIEASPRTGPPNR